MSWGLLIERVEKVEGMRGRRRWAVLARALDACVMEGLGWGRSRGLALWLTRDELESLILAQNERWRHA